jgi:hypothetical protein
LDWTFVLALKEKFCRGFMSKTLANDFFFLTFALRVDDVASPLQGDKNQQED